MTKKSKWQEYKEKNGVTPFDLLRSDEYASDAIAEQRYSICKACPEFISLSTQCKKCGCVMKLKTKLISARCPIEKW